MRWPRRARGSYILLRTHSTFVNTPTLRADRTPVKIQKDGVEHRFEKIGAIIDSQAYVAPHVMIMSGIRVGFNSFVGSFQILEEDVPKNTIIKPIIEKTEKPFFREFPEASPQSLPKEYRSSGDGE